MNLTKKLSDAFNEQVEEEEAAKAVLDKFEIFGTHGLYSIDHYLAKR